MYHSSQGKSTRQAHKGIPENYYEEEQGTKGFFGPVSHLIRENPSTHWVDIDGPLKPRMYDLVELPQQESWQRLFYNSHLCVYYFTPKTLKTHPSHFSDQDFSGINMAVRNADGDLIYFCHQGRGEVFTDYGWLSYEKGQYLVVPKCLTHFILPLVDSQFLVIENRSSHYEQPDRGIVGKNGLYDMNALVIPDLAKQESRINELKMCVSEVKVKHLDQITHFKYQNHIFDVVGWKGDLYPFTLDTKHIMPLMSHRAHLPPSAHSTFVARDFIICTFLPRPLESDQDALKVPFYHQNIDYDEILFYHEGDFFSRDHLHPGMLSFHPAGFAHGPHPKAMKSISQKTETNEYAVMLDSRWPLMRDSVLDKVELKNYWRSWQSTATHSK